MRRRRVLAAVATTSTVALAGCSSDLDNKFGPLSGAEIDVTNFEMETNSDSELVVTVFVENYGGETGDAILHAVVDVQDGDSYEKTKEFSLPGGRERTYDFTFDLSGADSSSADVEAFLTDV